MADGSSRSDGVVTPLTAKKNLRNTIVLILEIYDDDNNDEKAYVVDEAFCWCDWQTETGHQFDYKSEDFTLERIIEWGFDQFTDKIKDISSAASKELAIENGLAEINAIWEYTSFDLVPYKDKGHLKIRCVAAVTTRL